MRKLLIIASAVLLSGLSAPTMVSAHDVASEATVAVDDAQFTLQVASFNSSDRAEALKRTIPEAWIQQVQKGGRIVYRVNYKRFIKRSQALQAKWDLEDLGHNGLVQRLFS